MKTASGIVALFLGLLTLLNVAGCSKAEKEYGEFIAYSNSAQGGIEGFLRGWSGASQGDPFGAALNIVDQERTLIANTKDARWSAWACLIGTALFSLVCVAIPSKKPAVVTLAAPTDHSAPTQMPPPTPEHTVEERLRTLLQLKERGLITPEEYDARARQILEFI